jgi:hypothetical protein
MFSTTSCWKYGGSVWSVTHDSAKGLSHLEIEGPVPATLEPIRQTLLAKVKERGADNADVDFLFDAPVNLAQELTGYRYDQDIPGLPGDVYEVLEPTDESPKRLLGRVAKALFGRKTK